jgi:hypothetical protein
VDYFSGIGGEIRSLISPMLPYREITIDTPILVTPTSTASSILAGKPYKWVFSFIIRVRSMGTATYIRLGTFYGQSYTLALYGQTLEWAGNPGEVCDLSKIFAISDTSDSSIEIIAAVVPLHLVGLVEQSVGAGL